jgi:CDP-glycerol glycerophosphotransferase (TagB/SpsB family)
VQEISIRALFNAARSRSVEIVIKPHYIQDEALWHRFVQAEGEGVRAIVASASENFLELVASSDALVLAYWSTAIIEAAILKLPIICMDFKRNDSRAASEWHQEGLLRIVRNEAELRSEIEKIIAAPMTVDTPKRGYYLGSQDGRNSERVAAIILGQKS